MSKIIVWQMKPVWGLPNGSPFCMKLETWLKMAGLPYETRELSGPPRSASGKAPYIERPDGSLLADSTTIVETLTREHGVSLDAHLGPTAEAVGTLLQRTFEEDLYFHLLYDRWAIDDNWRIVKRAYFGTLPAPVRATVVPFIRRKVIASARGQGVARLSPQERAQRARKAIGAVAHLLGEQSFFFEKPSRFDATAYAFLANVLSCPVEIRSVAGDAAREHPNLVSYCARMQQSYFR